MTAQCSIFYINENAKYTKLLIFDRAVEINLKIVLGSGDLRKHLLVCQKGLFLPVCVRVVGKEGPASINSERFTYLNMLKSRKLLKSNVRCTKQIPLSPYLFNRNKAKVEKQGVEKPSLAHDSAACTLL